MRQKLDFRQNDRFFIRFFLLCLFASIAILLVAAPREAIAQAPPQVTGVTATPSGDTIVVNWNSVTGAAAYTINWNGNSQTNQTTATTYTISPAHDNVEYSIAVAADSQNGDQGEYSAPATAEVVFGPPSLRAFGGASTIVLYWEALPTATSYAVFENTSNQLGGPQTGTSYTVTGVGPGFHWFDITATNPGGSSPKSNYVLVYTGSGLPRPNYIIASVPYVCPCEFGASGPSSDDPVDVSTGIEDYDQRPDLEVYNPSGPEAIFQREYRSDLALDGDSSPGLSPGWTYNYDISIQGLSSSWGNLYLAYSNGAQEQLTPTMSGGLPTGAFTTVAGAPYTVSGTPSGTTGQWNDITVTWKDRTQWVFMPVSGVLALVQITNRMGKSLDLTWDSNRYLDNVTDDSTGTVLLTLSYSNGSLSSVTDNNNRQVSYSFSTFSGLNMPCLQSVSQIVASGTSDPPAHWTYGYATSTTEPLLNAITVPSPTGSGTSTAQIYYNSTGQVTSLVDANGNKQVFTLGSSSSLIQVENSSGTVVYQKTQKFDGQDRNTGVTDASGHSTTVAYGDSNNPYLPTSFTDGNNKTWNYTYDQYGNLKTIVDPRSTTTTYTNSYTNWALGELEEVKVGTKSPTSFSYYEPSGLIDTITSPLPGTSGSSDTVTTGFTYDSLGNVLTVTAPGNNSASSITTTYNYTSDPTYSYTQNDSFGEPLTATDNLGDITHYRYNSRGLPITVIDAIGNETDYGTYSGDQTGGYDLADDLLQVTYPATGESGTGRSYDLYSYLYPGGPLQTVKTYDESDAQVAEDLYAYGLEGELTSVTGSDAPVFYGYNAAYDVTGITDGDSHTTTYTYDTTGRLTQVAYPGSTSSTVGSSDTISYTSFDGDENPLKRIDGNNVETDYTYNDPESFLTKIHYPGGQLGDSTFGYDSYGRRNAMTDPTGSTTYTYDDLDNLLSATTGFTSGPSDQSISYTLYPDNSRESMTSPAGAFSYSYDGAERLTSLTNPFSETTGWTYQDNDWLSTQSLNNGATTTYTYDALGNITDLVSKTSGAVTLSDFGSMAYNGAGDLTTVTANVPGYSTYSGTTGYTYDTITGVGTRHQLTQEASTRNGSYTNNFAYDGGSYTGSTGVGNPTTFRGNTNSFNSDNENTANTYDGNGNPTTYAGASLSFDPENRLTDDGSILSATYNGDGLRATKTDSTGTTYYLYDGEEPVVEENSAGTVTATNTFGANGLVSRNAGGSSIFYTFDEQGNVAQRLDSSQNVLTSDLYDSFGAGVSSGTPTDPFGYGAQWGYYTDRATGLVLCTHRYYDPSSGRFLTRDPIGYDGGLNLYGYVGNDPDNWADSTGFNPVEQNHDWPKALGGDDNQPLTPYEEGEHDQFHNDLNKFLRGVKNAKGDDMCPRKGNPGWRIRQNFTPQEIKNALGRFFRGPGSKYKASAKNFFEQNPDESPEAIKQAGAEAAEEVEAAEEELEVAEVELEAAEVTETIIVVAE